MTELLHASLFFVLCFATSGMLGQSKSAGPIVQEFGEVSKVPDQDFKIDSTTTFKVVFDIMHSPEDKTALNKSIETAARFLNMHAQNGVEPSRMKVALVVHNAASKDIITNTAYRQRYGTDNPNQVLVAALLEVGAQVIFCGQSSQSRGFPKEDLIDGVQMSLSAMTALIQLQNEAYRLIKF